MCLCVSPPKKLVMDVTVFYILLSADQGAFVKVPSLMCILATTVSQQDVFPERKRGWEEGPNVDLFLLLSFLFWLCRSAALCAAAFMVLSVCSVAIQGIILVDT